MKHACPRRGGHTLIEVVVSMLLVAVMATFSMPAFLTGRMAAGRSQRRNAAADAVQRLSEELKNYVTADRTIVDGPGTGPDGWSLPGDSGKNWALAPGQHDLQTALWAPALTPFQGSISYTVTVRATASGPEPSVAFRVGWEEP